MKRKMNIQKSMLALANSTEKIIYFDGKHEITEDYASLFNRSLSILGSLQHEGMNAGDIVLLDVSGVYAQIACFWACILGGIIPTILPEGSDSEAIHKIAENLPDPTLITSKQRANESLKKIDFTALNGSHSGKIVRRQGSDPGMIQLSSGSVGNRRNVLLTMENLWVGGVASSVVVRQGMCERYLNWLPLSHCFGFVGYHLVPIVNDFPQYHMDTAAFVKQPELWLQKLSEFRATMTGAARFGLNLLINHECAIDKTIDLSHLYICFCGGEDLLEEELHSFECRFAPKGLKQETLKPAYGLSETTMGVAYTPPGAEMKTENLVADAIVIGKPLVFSEKDHGIRRMSVGILDECNTVQIRDTAGDPLADGCLGEIHIAGDNVMHGYLQKDGSIDRARDGKGYFNTGDLGFFHDGWLCIYGRIKDVLIVNGKNVNRLDLEKIGREACGNQGELAIVQSNLKAGNQPILFGAGVDQGALTEAAKMIGKKAGIGMDGTVKLEALPRTDAGKLDRLTLERGLEQGLYSIAPLTANSGETKGKLLNRQEQRLAELWSVVLEVGMDEIGQNTDFFADLGGSSLSLMDLISQIEERFDVVINEETLLNHSTLENMADVLILKNGESAQL